MSILIEDLIKRFGAQLVLDRVSLEVAEGELFVLLGASGSGKSTLLRVIAGLSAPDRGRVVMAGRDVTSLRPQERGTGFVFQNYSVFRHMTVAQNIEFGLRLRKVAKAERARRRDELLDLVGLPGFGSREAMELSGGQQQRVAIARALAYEPKVLLLDEPFGALDVKIRTHLRRSLREIHDRLRITTVLVTHDQDEAFELADRVGLVDRGRLIEVGLPEDLYARPRTLFAATFLGSGTVLMGKVEDGQARFHGLKSAIPPERPHEDGSPAHLLIRPEDVLVSAEPIPGPHPELGKGRVVEQSFGGAIRRVRIRFPHRADVHQASSPPTGRHGFTVDALLPAQDPLPPDEVWVALRRWHFLDPPPVSLLAADDGRGPSRALKIAREMARRLNAQITVLGVAAEARESAALGWKIRRRQAQAGLAESELRVRYGNPPAQILSEQAELLSQFIVLAPRSRWFEWPPWNGRPGTRRKRLGKTIQTVLDHARVPVLVVMGRPADLRHTLVLWEERAQADDFLRASARLCRQLGLEVTVIHVSAGSATGGDGSHGQATALFESMGVQVRAEALVEAGALESTASRVFQFASDLMVMPVPRRGPHEANEITPLANELLERSDRPMLMMPTERWGAPE